ncbi:hypothetical protein [Coleofasciculus chthonoplastes]|jgi:hypothetical protein|uniref:hypothetical protein n=1 Tax=Coleofasciculus TaxID=669368 RepID=UPI003301DD64
MPLDCTGESLPDIPEIESQENPKSLDDFCLILNTNDQVIFISNSTSLEAVYINPSSYKIIGVLIAPANTRSFSRGELNPIVAINSHKVLIRTLPKNALSDCKITWTDLLQRIGLPPNYRAGTSNPEFDIPVTHTPS